jgi:thioredoxin-like negative regulator of GroEL
MAIRRVSEDDYESFLLEKEFAVVLFDAPWDVGPGASIRPPFEAAAEAFSSRVNFGEVNCDEFDRVKSVPIVNVPTVAYYKGGRLIAAPVGASQDVTARTRAMLEGKRIGRKDGWG